MSFLKTLFILLLMVSIFHLPTSGFSQELPDPDDVEEALDQEFEEVDDDASLSTQPKSSVPPTQQQAQPSKKEQTPKQLQAKPSLKSEEKPSEFEQYVTPTEKDADSSKASVDDADDKQLQMLEKEIEQVEDAKTAKTPTMPEKSASEELQEPIQPSAPIEPPTLAAPVAPVAPATPELPAVRAAPRVSHPRIQAGTVNQGGGEKTIHVQHPHAAKGLIKINKDGSYQYKVKLREKSQSVSFGFSTFTAPVITNTGATISYSSMYGGNPIGFSAGYEWMPFQRFGSLGLLLESGISVSRGRGKLADGNPSEEVYSLYMIPLTAFLKYRFEYMRRQWVVPYILGGGTYYGLVEARDDGASPTLAGSAAVGGGGGLHINLSRMDAEGALRLDREWGIADMWLTLEMRVMQGLKRQIDFTNATLQAGITLDY